MIEELLQHEETTKAISPEEYCSPILDDETAELQRVQNYTPFDFCLNKKFTRKTARSALDVLENLRSERDVAKVALKCRNTNALAIGMMLNNGYRKDLIDPTIPPSTLMAEICKRDISEGHLTVFNRHRAISHMKSLGFISGSQIDRQIRPSGTTPSIRIIGSLIHHDTKGMCSLEKICSSSRGKEIVLNRFKAIWILRNVCGHSLSTIGNYMGNRDHTTVLNSINKMNLKFIKDEDGFAAQITGMCERADMMGVIQGRNILIRSALHRHHIH
jgi:hypothetical protein